MKTDYQALCLELFGTDDVEELRRIARAVPGRNSRKAGRKPQFSKTEVAAMQDMRAQGVPIRQIAETFGTSRQTVSKYLSSPMEEEYTLRIDYMYGTRVCSRIFVDFRNSRLKVSNYTDNRNLRAFGVNEAPTWEDFEVFLEDRCFPKTRANVRDLLEALGLQSYDPLQIVEKTGGRTYEDPQWMRFTYRGAHETRHSADR